MPVAKKKQKKHWWWKFEPDKWLADEGLRECSWAAKGLWITMLSLMSKNARVGYLGTGDVPPTPEKLTRSVGGLSVEEVSFLVAELTTSGVLSMSEDGFIYSRKMVRDHVDFKKAQSNGSKGGNPKIKKGVNPTLNPKPNPALTLTSTSPGVTTLEEVQEKPELKGGNLRAPNPLWDCVVELWGLSPKVKGGAARIGLIVSDFKALEATPDEIRIRLGRYRRKWPTWADTANSLIKYWGSLKDEPTLPPTDQNLARVGAAAGKYSGLGLTVGRKPEHE